MDNGYIRLYRDITSWEWYDDINTFRVFVHLLLTCNWKERKWHGHTIHPGQRVVSLATLAEETGLTVKSVRNALDRLERAQSAARSKIGKVGIITIKNWDKYQTEGTVLGTERARKGHGKGTERATNEEGKKGRNKEIPPYSPPKGTLEQYRQVFLEECPSLPKPQEASGWSSARKKALKSKRVSLEEFRDVCKKIERSDFLTGRSGTWAGCSFDWILKPANWQKIIEGNYDNRGNRHNDSYDIDELEEIAKFNLPADV